MQTRRGQPACSSCSSQKTRGACWKHQISFSLCTTTYRRRVGIDRRWHATRGNAHPVGLSWRPLMRQAEVKIIKRPVDRYPFFLYHDRVSFFCSEQKLRRRSLEMRYAVVDATAGPRSVVYSHSRRRLRRRGRLGLRCSCSVVDPLRPLGA